MYHCAIKNLQKLPIRYTETVKIPLPRYRNFHLYRPSLARITFGKWRIQWCENALAKNATKHGENRGGVVVRYKQYTFLDKTPASTRTLLCFIPNSRSDRKFNIPPVANDARRYFECLHEIFPDCISSIDQPQRDQIGTALQNCRKG